MIEQEWMESNRWEPLLTHGLASTSCLTQRKLALFLVQCCRLLWDWMPEQAREVLLALESLADKPLDRESLEQAFRISLSNAQDYLDDGSDGDLLRSFASWAVYHASGCLGWDKATPWPQSYHPLRVVQECARGTSMAQHHTLHNAAIDALIAGLLRHIAGNPFRKQWLTIAPDSILCSLALRCYDHDQAVVGPLHDALIENNFSELASHFASPATFHPKGCWALDLILGKG